MTFGEETDQREGHRVWGLLPSRSRGQNFTSQRAAVGASERNSLWAGRGDKERVKPWKEVGVPIPEGAGDHGSRVTRGGSLGLCAAAYTTPLTTVCHLPSLKTHPNAHISSEQFFLTPFYSLS